jgi:hypothetical protein
MLTECLMRHRNDVRVDGEAVRKGGEHSEPPEEIGDLLSSLYFKGIGQEMSQFTHLFAQCLQNI